MTTNCIGVFRYWVRSCLLCFSVVLLGELCVGQSSISLSSRSGPPTSNIFVSGKSFKPHGAIDIYFDTANEALAVADASGAFSKIPIRTPSSAHPGKHWVTAIQRAGLSGDQVPFTVNTNWNQFHFSPDHKGFNPYENVLGPSTVGRVGLRWSFPAVGQVESAPVEANGVVYFGAGFTVYALNATTGRLRWQYSAGSFVGGPAVAGHLVYVSSADHKVYALNAGTGTLLWSYETVNGIVPTTPTVANGMVYVGSWDKNVYALNANTGALVWVYTTSNSVFSTPAVVNGVVYFGSFDNNVYALSASTGNLLWQYTAGSFGLDSTPTVVNGIVYIGSWDKKVYALNASNGALVWQYATDSAERTSAAVDDGIVYVTSDGGFVYALNAYTGALIWDYNTGSGDNGFPPSSPTVARGVVYGGFQDGKIYALDASGGSLLWQYTTGNAVSSTPAVVNGRVYVGSWDNTAYAFGLPNPEERQRPEPMSLHPDPKLKPSRSAADLIGTDD